MRDNEKLMTTGGAVSVGGVVGIVGVMLANAPGFGGVAPGSVSLVVVVASAAVAVLGGIAACIALVRETGSTARRWSGGPRAQRDTYVPHGHAHRAMRGHHAEVD